MNEIWKDIKGYEGYYEISNIGRVRSVSRIINHPKLVKQNIFERLLNLDSQNGYKSVRLSKEHKSKKCFVHRLVAQAFIKNPDSKGQVNHKDGDKSNNKVDNLEWNTAKENITHVDRIPIYQKFHIIAAPRKKYSICAKLICILIVILV